ncbi:hypothetical protein [Allostreptomyces psammosilenae]|uniref:Uncharacterized protein n=1 Tax=Allostreptomyces psammosilenae TaxID=1892865 RepID=A0A852ZYP7_9ACTN|nr:hypothetical protein [Allostreptomyces psammosilenae]NYI07279.1 hypothetical protein [Allostreptomyces psammosilenae]
MIYPHIPGPIRIPTPAAHTRSTMLATLENTSHWPLGNCWLACGRTNIPVAFLSPIILPGNTATGLYGCADCLRAWGERALEHILNGGSA